MIKNNEKIKLKTETGIKEFKMEEAINMMVNDFKTEEKEIVIKLGASQAGYLSGLLDTIAPTLPGDMRIAIDDFDNQVKDYINKLENK